ncbi:PaaI family thioesterase [Hippea maritima]|uniref:Phenylacetic acid degradation-related protein n=1 Tax=Hippea maritima (strain ATCC 700847 / DSM 10411 / MH2) TaxID=760142 RepID=F2LY87_HIPMA|nr:PaaI family thioesterase [Hippea maritima]AEA34410.1 phenylacetic acid degradation-related protein [Hippea maritima DSM 10411]
MYEKIKKLLNENDRFAKHNNMRLIEVKEGYAVATMKIEEKHLNAAGVVQGGVIFTLADLAFGAAANSRGILNLSLNATISFIKATDQGILKACAKEISRNKRVAVYQIDVKNENDELIAIVQGVAYSKGKTIQ